MSSVVDRPLATTTKRRELVARELPSSAHSDRDVSRRTLRPQARDFIPSAFIGVLLLGPHQRDRGLVNRRRPSDSPTFQDDPASRSLAANRPFVFIILQYIYYYNFPCPRALIGRRDVPEPSSPKDLQSLGATPDPSRPVSPC